MPLLTGDLVLLPPSEYSWITDRPDEELSNLAQLTEELQTHATLAEEFVTTSRLHLTAITRDLTRQLTYLTDDVYDEVSASIQDEWGTETEDWKEVNPFTTVLQVVARTSSRVFVGKPLCRNAELNKHALDFASTVMPTALVLRRFPAPLRPFVAPLFGYKNRSCRKKMTDIMRPEIAARLNEVKPEKPAASIQHNDFLQWMINLALSSGNLKECEPSIIAQRLNIVNFAAIHTSSITLTNAIYNLVSSPDYHTIIDALRDEITKVFASTEDGKWSKHAVSNLRLLDSFFRESTRISPISVFAMTRKVVAPGGIMSPISNTFLPEGSSVAIPSLSIHRDPSIYEDPEVFKPFRFVDMRDQTTANLNMSTTSLQYATFGHGRHACPGRFFATLELKLMLAYMVQNYDFEMLEKRPENPWAGQICIPPIKNTIRIRRRTSS